MSNTASDLNTVDNGRSVTLDVSREGIVANLKDQFTEPDTFLRELFQNARRAGADRIDVSFDPETRELVVADNGAGIGNPEDLFILGHSGFRSLDAVAAENPFGMGFAASLFSADEIEVNTRNFSCQFRPEEAMRFHGIDVREGGFAGTRIRLTLTEGRQNLLVGDIHNARQRFVEKIGHSVSGFPIPVYVNGEKIQRPHALDDDFIEFDGGFVRIDFETASPVTRPRYFLQGLPVKLHSHRRWVEPEGVIVHLNPDVRARTPDRDQVVAEQVNRVDARVTNAIRAAWIDFLTAKKEVMSPVEFVRVYGDNCVSVCPDLLVDMPLPRDWFEILDEPPRMARWECEDMESVFCGRSVPLPEPGASLVRVETDAGCFDQDGALRGLYAFLLGRPIVTKTLPEGHWANPVDLDEREPEVKIDEEVSRVSMFGHGMDCEVVFCQRFRLSLGDDLPTFTVDDRAVYTDFGELIVPANASHGAVENGLLQRCSYQSEFDEHREEWLEEDLDKVMAAKALAFDTSLDLLERLVCDGLGSVSNCLRGQRLVIEFDEAGRVSIEKAD